MRNATRLAPLALSLALAVTAVTALAVALGSSHGAGAAVVFRSLAALTVLAVVLMWAVAQWRSIGAGAFILTAGVTYVMMPFALAGRGLFGQLITGHPLVCLLLDGVVWMAVATAVVLAQVRRHPRVPDDAVGG